MKEIGKETYIMKRKQMQIKQRNKLLTRTEQRRQEAKARKQIWQEEENDRIRKPKREIQWD